MATPVIMPKFGMAQEEGTVLRWLKQEGDLVEKGDALLSVMTDKVDMEVEAPAAGVLRSIRVGADATVPVATVLAYILAPDEALPAGAASAPRQAVGAAVEVHLTTASPVPAPVVAPVAVPVKASPVAQRMARDAGVDLEGIAGSGPRGRIRKADVVAAQAEPTGAPGKVRATPAARRLARESGVPLADVAGSGPAGRIQAADVISAARQLPPTQVEVTGEKPAPQGISGAPLRGMRKVIAARLAQSWQAAPHVTFTASIDMTAVDALRARLAGEIEELSGARFTPTVVIARAVATALLRHRRLNAWLLGEAGEWSLLEHDAVHLGIAVALDDGLIVPVVRNAEGMGLAALARAVGDLAGRARSGKLTPDEVAGGTFTISNLGMYPIDHFTAIINPPQVAILAVGRAQVQPVWDGQAFQPRPLLRVTLSADHRAVDGAAAAAFLGELKRLLEEPVRMLL